MSGTSHPIVGTIGYHELDDLAGQLLVTACCKALAQKKAKIRRATFVLENADHPLLPGSPAECLDLVQGLLGQSNLLPFLEGGSDFAPKFLGYFEDRVGKWRTDHPLQDIEHPWTLRLVERLDEVARHNSIRLKYVVEPLNFVPWLCSLRDRAALSLSDRLLEAGQLDNAIHFHSLHICDVIKERMERDRRFILFLSRLNGELGADEQLFFVRGCVWNHIWVPAFAKAGLKLELHRSAEPNRDLYCRMAADPKIQPNDIVTRRNVLYLLLERTLIHVYRAAAEDATVDWQELNALLTGMDDIEFDEWSRYIESIVGTDDTAEIVTDRYFSERRSKKKK